MTYEIPLSRIEEMAEVTADAFIGANDPIGNFMFQNEPEPLILKKRFFRSLVTSCSPGVIRQGSSQNLEAVSIWFPPGLDHSQDADPDPFQIQDFKDPETMQRMKAVNEVIRKLTADLGSEPQWYLHLVAVPPKFRNLGYASQLIRPMLAKAVQAGLPCTLITQNKENVRKYESWGFKIVREMPVPGSQEKFYSMRKN